MSEPLQSPLVEELVSRCAAGDEAATRALAQRLMPFAAGVVRACVPDRRREEQDEILGQILMWMVAELRSHCQQYDAQRGTVLAFFRTVFRRYLSRYWRDGRAQKRRNVILEMEPSEHHDESPNAEQALARQAPARLVNEWIQTQKRRDQMIIRERILGESSSKDLADLLGMTPAAIDTQVRRLKGALRDWIEQRGAVELVMCILLWPMWALARWWAFVS